MALAAKPLNLWCMNLEQLKTQAADDTYQVLSDVHIGRASLQNAFDVIDSGTEHTHTQTIQSVRERVEGMQGFPIYNEFKGEDTIYVRKADLLKDLEAPVEGDNVN